MVQMLLSVLAIIVVKIEGKEVPKIIVLHSLVLYGIMVIRFFSWCLAYCSIMDRAFL